MEQGGAWLEWGGGWVVRGAAELPRPALREREQAVSYVFSPAQFLPERVGGEKLDEALTDGAKRDILQGCRKRDIEWLIENRVEREVCEADSSIRSSSGLR